MAQRLVPEEVRVPCTWDCTCEVTEVDEGNKNLCTGFLRRRLLRCPGARLSGRESVVLTQGRVLASASEVVPQEGYCWRELGV